MAIVKITAHVFREETVDDDGTVMYINLVSHKVTRRSSNFTHFPLYSLQAHNLKSCVDFLRPPLTNLPVKSEFFAVSSQPLHWLSIYLVYL